MLVWHLKERLYQNGIVVGYILYNKEGNTLTVDAVVALNHLLEGNHIVGLNLKSAFADIRGERHSK